jgi:hypothetical protein
MGKPEKTNQTWRNRSATALEAGGCGCKSRRLEPKVMPMGDHPAEEGGVPGEAGEGERESPNGDQGISLRKDQRNRGETGTGRDQPELVTGRKGT